MVDLMVNPPKKGDESFDLYNSQIDGIFQSLRKRAVKLEKAFNSLHGVSCNPAQGALYLFPRITIPQKAIEKAKQDNIEPDALYCMELLQETGICLVYLLLILGTWIWIFTKRGDISCTFYYSTSRRCFG